MAQSFALVTGGSSGIGFQLARQFATHSFDVVIVADVDAQASAEELAAATGAHITAIQADLAEYAEVERVVETLSALVRPLDAVALNAGFGNGGSFLDIPLVDELKLINTNVTAVVHLAKRLLPDMVARRSGRILVTASVASTMPGPYYATYAASKAFDLSFAEALRHELKNTGVTVTALLPGPTDTEFFDRANMQDTKADEGHKDDPAEVAADAFKALMDGKDKVIAGSARNALQVAATAVLPDTAKAAMHARLTEPHH